MASYNPSNSQAGGFQYLNSAIENRGFFSRMLRNLSSLGMNYDEMVMRNQVGVGINEDPYNQKGNSMYDFFSQKAVASVLNRKSIPYLDKSYPDKRRILREYSIKDEIRDFLSTIADETVIYDDDKDFCKLRPLSNDYPQEVRDKYQEYFEKVYNRYGFADTISAWNYLKDFLIDGFIAMEIVYDDKKKNIIAFNRLRPETLVPAFEPSIGHLWIQYPEDPQLRRIFLDSQIIYVSHATQNDYSETSYIEGLIKPYNQLKILEQTRIMFNIINATIYQMFTIPTKGLPRQRAEEQIGQLIHDYSEEVEWDDTLGTLKINGHKHLPYNKQLWFPDGDAGKPAMELVSPTGHNLNEDTMLKWFGDALKRASKIPFTRFEKESGGGTMFQDASQMTRDEVKFSNFISRIRANFKELITKPIKLQMLIEFPELKDDEVFNNEVDVIFNSNDLFEEWKHLSNLEKRSGIVGNLLQIMKADQTPFFHIDYLMDKIFKLSPEDKAENSRYWMKEKAGGGGAAPAGAPGGELGGGEFGAPGGDLGGGELGAPGGDLGGELGGGETAPTGIPEGGDLGGGAPPAGGEAPPAPEGGGGEFEF